MTGVNFQNIPSMVDARMHPQNIEGGKFNQCDLTNILTNEVFHRQVLTIGFDTKLDTDTEESIRRVNPEALRVRDAQTNKETMCKKEGDRDGEGDDNL